MEGLKKLVKKFTNKYWSSEGLVGVNDGSLQVSECGDEFCILASCGKIHANVCGGGQARDGQVYGEVAGSREQGNIGIDGEGSSPGLSDSEGEVR